MSNRRETHVAAQSTTTFGRVLCRARNHHFVIDGPEQNGCPGEALNPVEAFLSGVAACGVELVQVIARERDVPLQSVAVEISGVVDRDHPVRRDLTVFNEVRLRFRLGGVPREQGVELVESFKGR